MQRTNIVDIAIFGVDVDQKTHAYDLLVKLQKHNVLMEILSWGDDFTNGMQIVQFRAKDENMLIEFGMDLYDVDEDLVRETFFGE